MRLFSKFTSDMISTMLNIVYKEKDVYRGKESVADAPRS